MNSMQATGDGVNPHQVFRQTNIFGALNGVRALCCLMVLKEHAEWITGSPKILDHGHLGVDVFFIISGFLIVTLMIRERESRGRIDVPAFYARRALRIFPLYYGVVLGVSLFYLAISPWRPNGWEYYSGGLIVLLTYTQNIIPANLGSLHPAWSLAMEEQFYLFWPAVEYNLANFGRWMALAGVMCVSQAVNFRLLDPLLVRIYGPDGPIMPFYLITFMPIALGVGLAYLLHNRRSFAVLYRIVGGRWAFLPLTLAATLLVEFSWSDSSWPRLGIHLIFALLIGALVIRPDHHAMRGLAYAPLARIGTVSYGIYIYHQPILDGLRRFHVELHPALLFLVGALLTIAVAELSFRFFEKPLLNLRARFRNRPRSSSKFVKARG